MSPASDDFLQRFGGIARLYGQQGLTRLQAAEVCVIGVGGVGSWTVEALARSGVGSLTIIDLDDVCITNVNRQLPALDDQIGQPKVAVLADRVKLIHPGCLVHPILQFVTAASAPQLLQKSFSFVVDATDRLSNKCAIIVACQERSIPVLTIGGAGGKRDGTAIRVSDLAHSVQDELLRQVRRKLRREHAFPRDVRENFNVSCVFSPELPNYPWADGTCSTEPEPGSARTLDCASGFGSATAVTGAFGFAAAGEVIRRIVIG